jgi:hypothetical protein
MRQVQQVPLSRAPQRLNVRKRCTKPHPAAGCSSWSNWFDATSNDCGRSGKVAYCLLAQACNVILEGGQSVKGRYKIRSDREINSQWMLSVSKKYSDSE